MDAKIFRVNYKSDFILTLTSDAGWMTPFCIKFWTGSPQLAYYASYDGETYTHCTYDPSEPTKLTVQFDDHHLPIGNLKYQVAYHFTVADFPEDTEDEVTNQANVTTVIDGDTYQVMLDLNGETAPEIQFALPAYANELQRIQNEQTRIAQEQQRVNQEQQRVSQEAARVTEFNGIVNTANNDHVRANEDHSQALSDHQNALADRSQAASDHSRAQSDHNTATIDHSQANSDHSRAQSDHNTALSDHQTALSDHTQANTDHSRAESDHTRATSDSSTAAADHRTAATDHTQANTDHTRAESDHQRVETDLAEVEEFSNSLGPYDISAANATGSTLATYPDLATALGQNGSNIPEALRKGGMSVKFVLTSDNKYVQYRLMAAEFSTDTAQWQGVDASLKAGSKNLVESGVVYNAIKTLDSEINGGSIEHRTAIPPTYTGQYVNSSGKNIGDTYSYPGSINKSQTGATWRINVEAGEKYAIKAHGNSTTSALYVLTGTNDIIIAKVGQGDTKNNELVLDIEENGYLYVNDMQYSTNPGSVEKVEYEQTGGLKPRMSALEQSVTGLEESTAELSAEIYGSSTEERTSIAPTYTKKYCNCTAATIGNAYSGSFSKSQTGSCWKIIVANGEKYAIKAYGRSSAAALYVLTGANNIVLQKITSGNTKSEELILNITENGVLYVNDMAYYDETSGEISDNHGSVEKITIVTEGGIIPGISQLQTYVNNIAPLSGKTVILCGDSQINNTNSLFETIITAKTGANVLKCGFGGCRMAWRTDDGSSPYDAFTMVNIADCLVSGVFTSMDSAIEDVDSSYKTAYAAPLANLKTLSPQVLGDGDDFIVTIAYGSNDFSGGNGLGTPDEPFRKRSVLGAMQYAVKTLTEAYPKLQIIFVGLPYIVYEYETVEGVKVITFDSDDYVKTMGGVDYHRYDYSDAIQNNAKANHLFCFDYYRRCGRNKYNIFTLCPDGKHPSTDAGSTLAGEIYVKLLTSF